LAISFPKDPLSWDDWIANVDSLQFGATQTERIKKALEYLKTTLGENYLRKIQSSRRMMTYRFWGLLTNFAPWTRIELAALATDLKCLEGSAHLDRLLKSFQDKDEYEHAWRAFL
jgi:hypothetical protein